MNYTSTSYPHYAQWDYTFERVLRRNGLYTRWFQTLREIVMAPEGELTKREILNRVFGARDVASDDPYYADKMYIIDSYCPVRGYCSHMFGCMRGAGLIDYDKHSRTWYATTKGKFMVLVGEQM